MMTYYFKQGLTLLMILLFGAGISTAAPRILRSNTAGNAALWLSLKKETKGQYVLHIAQEGNKAAESFKVTSDSTGASAGVLKFAAGEEAKATAALKGYEDVIAHTAANDAEATGDAAGDINSFLNGVVRKDGAEGLLLLPATEPVATMPPTAGGSNWFWITGALVLGIAGGWMLNRALTAKQAEPLKKVMEDEEPVPQTSAAGTDINTAEQNAQKLKKVQKDLKDAKAALTQITKKAEAEAEKNAALEDDYQALEARLKLANNSIVTIREQAGALQTQLQQLQDQAARQEAYFKAAANNIVRPFTDYVSSSKINPIDKSSQAIVAEQVVVMAFHYFSMVRYGAGIWDEHDIYNLQRNGLFGAEHKAAIPQVVPVSVKSAVPNLVLTIAELLRQAGATGVGMDISLRGYRFEQNPG